MTSGTFWRTVTASRCATSTYSMMNSLSYYALAQSHLASSSNTTSRETWTRCVAGS
jgi:hypothetical protein